MKISEILYLVKEDSELKSALMDYFLQDGEFVQEVAKRVFSVKAIDIGINFHGNIHELISCVNEKNKSKNIK